MKFFYYLINYTTYTIDIFEDLNNSQYLYQLLIINTSNYFLLFQDNFNFNRVFYLNSYEKESIYN